VRAAVIDATTNRQLLTTEAYPDSTNLRARMSIYDYRQPAGDWFSWVLGHTDWPKSARVLDVGCGPGSYLERVDGIGIDLSGGMAREANRYAPTAVGDVCALPVASASVDRVLAPHMLYHAPDLDRGAAELARVMRPGGVALIVTNGHAHLSHLAEQLASVMETVSMTRLIDRFNLENGGDVLARQFRDVVIDDWRGTLVVPDADPVLRFADSCRSLYETQLREGATWGDAMADLRALVEQEISDTGAWRCVTHSGVFVCQ
jgi:SAM-dependent methyltransferase